MPSLRPIAAVAVFSVALIAAGPVVAAPACSARSGAQQATLIELFTSEGCSSCPPADRWLSGFTADTASAGGAVVPLAFHVDYWDYIGWPDRFAKPLFTARQQDRRRSTQGRFVYTPQTVVNGRDSNDWRQVSGPGRLPATASVAPGAELTLTIVALNGSAADVTLSGRLQAAAGNQPAVAYLALYENGLSSEVRRGENAGRQLRHDYVVREWTGPLAFSADGRLDTRQRLALNGVAASQAGVAAIVESRDGSRYLQALALPLCR